MRPYSGVEEQGCVRPYSEVEEWSACRLFSIAVIKYSTSRRKGLFCSPFKGADQLGGKIRGQELGAAGRGHFTFLPAPIWPRLPPRE